MPWLISYPSTLTRIVSVTPSVPSACTSISLRHEMIRSPCCHSPLSTEEGYGAAFVPAGSRRSDARSGASSVRTRLIGSGLGRAKLDFRGLLDRGVGVLVELRFGKTERAREQNVRDR